jgi:hypothetical protein
MSESPRMKKVLLGAALILTVTATALADEAPQPSTIQTRNTFSTVSTPPSQFARKAASDSESTTSPHSRSGSTTLRR